MQKWPVLFLSCPKLYSNNCVVELIVTVDIGRTQ